MILILGGTTEGRIAARVSDEAGTLFYYSTKGDEQDISLLNGQRLTGSLDAGRMETFCRENAIRLLIDAAHPFALQLHQTVIEVSAKLKLPVIRYERIYPPRNREIIWCKDYKDAIAKLEEKDIRNLLALTGVQSIEKLKPFWTVRGCRFRILNRDSSRQIAAEQGFPPERLLYYHPGNDEQTLFRELHTQAILLKESGVSGGFPEKVNAALEEKIKVFAIKREEGPHPDDAFYLANGEHGLRLGIQKYLPHFYPLHTGISTGTCATAAALAAVRAMFKPFYPVPEVPVTLPNGETIIVPIVEVSDRPVSEQNGTEHLMETYATVIKNSGDDPDVTNGLSIRASLSFIFNGEKTYNKKNNPKDFQIILRGGEGVGIVTLPGLGLEPGEPAINAIPRRMIEENLKSYLRQSGFSPFDAPLVITISVPGGEEIAKRTFNPRLGVTDGISIIGTSGIVRPFSSEAFIDAIRKEMEVAKATGTSCIVLNSGAKSEHAVRNKHPELPPQAFVHYGNFIGETLKIAAELEVAEVTMGVMIGKAVKLAEGHLDTHSKKVVMNKDFLKKVALQAGCSQQSISRIDTITLARELWTLSDEKEKKIFFTLLLDLCRKHCTPLFPNKLTILLIDEEGRIYP